MTRLALLASAALLAASCATSPSTTEEGAGGESTEDAPKTDGLEYPETRRQDLVETIHGTEVRDPYRWLEPNDGDEVLDWMKQQAELARDYLDDLSGRASLRERYRELYYVEAIEAPMRRGGRMFYARQHPDRQKKVYYWRPVEAPSDEQKVLLDPNEMGGKTNISVGTIVPSWNGKKVAYTLHENNQDRATLHVKDVDSGEVSDVDVIDGARFAEPAWTPDHAGFFYTRWPTDSSVPESERPGEVDIRYHELGTDPADDPVVREPTGDPSTSLDVELSRNGRWLFAYVYHGWNRSDVYYRDREADDPSWRTLVEGRDHKYRVRAHDGTFFIKTDEEAPRGRMLTADADAPDPDDWREIVPESENAVLEDFHIVGGHLLLNYLRDATNQLEVRKLDGTRVGDVSLPGKGTVYGITGRAHHDDAYFTYQSFKTPKRILRTDVPSGETSTWSEEKLPVDTSDIRVRQVTYESKDGTEIPMFVVSKGKLPRDGSTPFLMYGYGGFDVTLTPYFVKSILPWLEAGGAYAMPNLRGGGVYGEKWHRAGMLSRKQNTFDDFIAAAEYLTDNDYTRPERLAISGGSNGGLLVSAVATQRPELFGAVVCSVPLTDMVRYHEFGPAKLWINEYGDPSNPEHFEFLYDYSPYHNVEDGTPYPAFMMMSSAKDDRVHPMHARKMVAALQWATSGDDPILFRLERQAGHGGADRLAHRVAKATDKMAFLFDELDLDVPPAPEDDG